MQGGMFMSNGNITAAEHEQLKTAFQNFKTTWEAPISELQKDVKFLLDERDEAEKARNRGGLGCGGGQSAEANRAGFNTALRNLLRTGDQAPLKEFSSSIQNSMSVGSDPSGGYTVFPELDRGISSILRDVSPFRSIARIRPVPTGDSFEERYTLGGAGASWVAETATRGVTTQPDLKVLSVKLHEIYSMPEATQKLLDDSSTDIIGWLTEQVGIAFGESEGAAFVTGTGLGQPRGFTTYPTAATADATRAWETLEHVPSGNASGFAASEPEDALTDLMYKLKAGYRSRAVWMMNRVTAGLIQKFKDSQNRPIWVDSLQAGQPPVLLGFPVWLNEDMPSVAANNLPVAFGDFSQGYVIADRPGIKLLVDPYTSKPNVRLYSYRRIGGDCRDFNAIKALKISTT